MFELLIFLLLLIVAAHVFAFALDFLSALVTLIADAFRSAQK